MTLNKLQASSFDLYATDKGTHWHSFSGKSYLDHYETHFKRLRTSPGNILEIGVHQGGSVRLWRDYFDAGIVVGMDCLDVSQFQKSGKSLIIIQGSQSNQEDLKKVAECAPFKVIIDDGSHEPIDILTSFDFLWNTVLPGGFYCIEDLQRPLELGTHLSLDARFNAISHQLDAREGDIQAIHRYAHLILFQKVS